jgi:tetratricopeptide (TPR) repeat protein
LKVILLPALFAAFLFSQTSSDELQRYYLEAERALAGHHYAEAEQLFEKLKQLSPGTAEVYGRLGLTYFQEGKFEQAVPALRQALKLKPTLPNTDVLLAMSLSELGHYAEALPGLEKGFKRSNDSALKRMAGLQLQRAYTGLHRDSNAMEVALELNHQFPDDPEVLYHTSQIYANFAFLTLRKLSEVAPQSVWTAQAAAEADESQGNLNLAIEEYRRVLAIDPARRGIHFRLGRVLLQRSHRTGPQDEALKEFQQELELDPTNANAAYEIGEIYRRAGDLAKAEEFFGKALQSYPDFEEAQLGLGGVLITRGKPDFAIPHFQIAIKLNPGNEVSYYRLAQAYKALGNGAEQRRAMAEFQRIRSQNQGQPELVGKTASASPVTRQAVDGDANSEAKP